VRAVSRALLVAALLASVVALADLMLSLFGTLPLGYLLGSWEAETSKLDGGIGQALSLVGLKPSIWIELGALRPAVIVFTASLVVAILIYRASRRSQDAGTSTTRPVRLRSPLSLRPFTHALFGVGLFSGVSNVLMLTGSLFMLEVYDRVLPSRSFATLWALLGLVVLLFAFQAALDVIRLRVMGRIAVAFEERIAPAALRATLTPPASENNSDSLRGLRDVDAVRSFMSGTGPSAFFDLPWIPFYLFVISLFHPLLGLTAGIGALVLVVITLATELLSRGPQHATQKLTSARLALADTLRRNREAVTTLGMEPQLTARWLATNGLYLRSIRRASDVTNGLGAVSRAIRLFLQSAVLAVGAYLVINQQATAGLIIAGSILAGRALAPVDLAIGQWRSFVAARQAWARLKTMIAQQPEKSEPMALPPPKASLTLHQVTVSVPGRAAPLVSDVSLSLQAGDGLGVIGPSGSGKTTLVRAIVGQLPLVRGRVAIDGAELAQWPRAQLGQALGYLPQGVELLAGTIAENISRWEPDPTPDAIVAAAMAAGAHETIVSLPLGYETEVGDQGAQLSAGQRQRIALARALYRDPFLVVLDEPNAHLDADGEAALSRAIRSIRARGGIVVVVAHRPSVLADVDLVLALAGGRTVGFGPKDEVLGRVLRPAAASSLKVVKEGGP